MIPKWRPVQICCIGQSRREQGAIAPSPQIWADELTLFQEGGADYAHRVFKPSYGPEGLRLKLQKHQLYPHPHILLF